MEKIEEIISELKNFKKSRHTQKKYDEIFTLLAKLKSDAVEINDQDAAKLIWCYEKITEIQMYYINSFYLLKKKEYYKAWCELEKCEKRIQYLRDHFEIKDKDLFSIAFIMRQVSKFQSIYPNYIFTSYQLAIKSTICSICKRENSIRNHCGHVLREIYDGKRCVRYIKKCEPLHTAIVENPKWKYRVLFDTNEKREKVDNYNYSIIEYLIEILPSPFVEWNYKCSIKINSHSKFINFREDDECPCGSGNLYKDCCLKKDGVPRPHIDFYGFEPISEPEIKDDFSQLKPKRLEQDTRANETKNEMILTGISATTNSFFID
ncbi:MAG: SEC-C domain-containing protein [Candidatus Lokiarchaeota archaeon]